MSYVSFEPSVKTLMGPGPSDMNPRVLQAMSRPILGHLDPDFVRLMDDIKALLRLTFKTNNPLTFPVSAPGSAGMETCFVNLIEPGDDVLVCINGVFGNRMKENVERSGGTPIVINDDWGQPVSLDKVEKALKDNPKIKIVAFVHAETSTGVCSDAAAIASLARSHGAMTIMDCVTSLGGVPVLLDEWGIDAAYSGSQKCLSCAPGLSPVSFSQRAVEAIQNRKTKVQSWFLDLSLVMNYWTDGGQRSYHHTAPVNAMYGLHESLVVLHEEGLENSWKRHQATHEKLRDGLEALGFSYLVEQAYRLPQLNAVIIPEHLKTKEAEIRTRLLNEHSLEVGSGLGALSGEIWRIGLMGYGASQKNVDKCLGAIADVIAKIG